jgi:hypothetical protein
MGRHISCIVTYCFVVDIVFRSYINGDVDIESFSSDYECEYEYEIRQAKSMLYMLTPSRTDAKKS